MVERFGAAVDKVPVAHSLRILMVVCAFPVLLTFANVHVGNVYLPVVVPFPWAGLLPLFGLAATVGVLLSWIRYPNPWMMGPLIATIVPTASGWEFSSMSGLLANGGRSRRHRRNVDHGAHVAVRRCPGDGGSRHAGAHCHLLDAADISIDCAAPRVATLWLTTPDPISMRSTDETFCRAGKLPRNRADVHQGLPRPSNALA